MKDIYRDERNRQPIEINLNQQYLADQVKAPFEVAKMITSRCPNLYLYGGAVRNLLLGTSTIFPDFDFVGDFNLDEIETKFKDLVVKRNDKVTTIKIKTGDTYYDFTSAKDIKERLSINDLTISNICIAKDGTIIDHFGGIESLKKREIKIIDADAKIQALCSIAGMKIESKPEVIAKIMAQKYGKTEKDIVIYNQNGLNVFIKKSGNGYPQVLLRS